MGRIRILHLIYSLDTGGAERVVENYARFHDKNIFEPVVCSLTSGGFIAERIRNCGTEVIMLGKRKGLDFTILPKLMKLIREKKIEVVHMHNFSANLWGTIAAVFCGVPVILRTEHNVVVEDKKISRRIKYLINYILGCFQKNIIAVSEKVKNSHMRKDIFFSDKYVTIYNGIDQNAFQHKEDIKKYYNEFNINENYMVVLKIASLTPQKGHEYFLKAAKLILNDFNGVIFLIVGEGPKKKEIENLSKSLKIENNVIFTGIREDTSALLQLGDIFVLSSLWEGFPITILEAMAASKPIVATDVGGNSEAIINGVTGILVPPKNPEAIAKSVLYLLKNKKKAMEMGKKGRERFETEFTAEIMVRKTENIYNAFLRI